MGKQRHKSNIKRGKLSTVSQISIGNDGEILVTRLDAKGGGDSIWEVGVGRMGEGIFNEMAGGDDTL